MATLTFDSVQVSDYPASKFMVMHAKLVLTDGSIFYFPIFIQDQGSPAANEAEARRKLQRTLQEALKALGEDR